MKGGAGPRPPTGACLWEGLRLQPPQWPPSLPPGSTLIDPKGKNRSEGTDDIPSARSPTPTAAAPFFLLFFPPLTFGSLLCRPVWLLIHYNDSLWGEQRLLSWQIQRIVSGPVT